MSNQPTYGKVILAGAGPGDPELITVKAVRYLQQADVVLTDRLVSDEILTQFVNPAAIVRYVGKQGCSGNSTPQEDINNLLVQYASQNKLVVRLKGGDISIFSNILDELKTLVENHIPYELIPGVTAATGAAAYAGIPLTARDYSTAVRFLTSYQPDMITEKNWKELAETNDTLVFYMSSETLPTVVKKLIQYKIGKDKLLAVVEQATTPLQNVQIYDLYDCAKQGAVQNFISPSLLIVGKVVSLHEQFAWLQNSQSREKYFKPVMKLYNQSSVNSEKKRKNVSRA